MKLERAMSVVAVFAFAAPLLALGDPFVYSDHWPSGTGDETATEVSIPDGTTAPISTPDDVTRVARLTAISIGDGAVVNYSASSALTLSAALSGTGAFIGQDSALLTIASDNSGLVSPGHFAFTNAQVLVAHENGLGSAASGTAVFFFDTNSLLDFTANASGVYTNNVAMEVDCVASSGKLRIGIQPRTARLVQNNSFIHKTGHTGGGKNVYIDGSLEFYSGTITVPVQPGGTTGTRPYLYFSAVNGESHIWFTGDLTFVLRYAFFASYSSGLISHISRAYNFTASYYYHNLICEAEDVLSTVTLMPRTDSVLDLNGYDTNLKSFDNTYCGGNPKSSTGTAKFTVTSQEPAMLSLAGATTRTNAVAFTGAAGCCHDNDRETVFVYGVSTSTNLLDVAKGRVGLMWGAGWNGDVRVASGAELELESDKAMTNAAATLTVETGGQLVLRSGAACIVKSATIAGRSLDGGHTYTVVQLKEMGLPVDGDDLGFVDVRGEEISWNGWPTTPGAVADVPENLTVYVSDDDIAAVEVLGGINIRAGAAVVCTNLSRGLNLSASLTGTGTFKALDSEQIVLNGDNSCLLSPGTFYFTNTSVVVSNRYGLGSTSTAMVRFFYGDKDCDALLFRGAGLVVDAPITISVTNNNQRVVGPESAEDTLIFSNSFRFAASAVSSSADCNPTVYFRNKVRFAGGIFGTMIDGTGGHIYSYKNGDYAEVWFDSGVKPHFYYWFAGSDMLYHIGWDAIEWGYLACTYVGGGKFVCESDNVFWDLTTGYGSNGGDLSYLDLNGHDQSVSHLSNQYISQNPNGVGLVVTSALPATVTVSNRSNSTDNNFASVMANFKGAAAFTYSWTGTNEFTKRFSNTTGALTVDKGTFRLAQGAGWGGTNVFVKSGARLIVTTESMPVAFGTRALLGHQSWTKLEIEAGGTLELAASSEPAVVRTLVYNGQMMPAGTYTSSSGVGIAGSGALRVRSSTDGEPGAVIIVY